VERDRTTEMAIMASLLKLSVWTIFLTLLHNDECSTLKERPMPPEIVTIKQGKQPTAVPSAQQPEESTAMTTVSAKAEQDSTDPKQRSRQRGTFTAIARLHGSLIAEDNQLMLVATDDGARFRVQAVRPGSLTMQLLTLEPVARIGLFGFWPTSKGDIILSAFYHNDNIDSWIPHPDSPMPDELIVAGILESTEDHSFTIKVGRNRRTKGPRHTFIQISSPPLEDWQCGQWLQLRCQRQGTSWKLPKGEQQ
jgi:hypothetical protein